MSAEQSRKRNGVRVPVSSGTRSSRSPAAESMYICRKLSGHSAAVAELAYPSVSPWICASTTAAAAQNEELPPPAAPSCTNAMFFSSQPASGAGTGPVGVMPQAFSHCNAYMAAISELVAAPSTKPIAYACSRLEASGLVSKW
eukprot:Amastigsp_a676935_20.p4 type:complete len:143 gc:universal Amastigsp_a676935_20:509-937(+)